ncbi:MAG TPA: TetR/AcrR family transcriptional regulator [Symbiobacteriaceae bacterium]|jgi:AcrR family transcriptional regulator
MDVRIERTRQSLMEALITLMGEKGFDNISVANLTARAGCNRGTFYLHYKDKDELLREIEEDLLHGLVAQAGPFSLQRVSADQPPAEPEPALLDVFRYLAAHADAFRVLLGQRGDPAFLARLKAIMRQNVSNQLAWFQARGQQPPMPHDFLSAYLTSAHVGVIQHWLESGMKYSPEYLALLMTRMARFWASSALQHLLPL